MQISFAVTAKLISAFVFATRILQSLFFLNPKCQATSHLLGLYSLVCVGPGRKPRRPVSSQRGSINDDVFVGAAAFRGMRARYYLLKGTMQTRHHGITRHYDKAGGKDQMLKDFYFVQPTKLSDDLVSE